MSATPSDTFVIASRARRVRSAGLLLCALIAPAMLAGGCSVVRINGSQRTDNNSLCLVQPSMMQPEMHGLLLKLLKRKRFQVTELAPGTKPGVCRQTLVYNWGVEQYYIPALVKQYPVNFDYYVMGEKIANASFDPTRNMISPHVKYVRSSRYWARILDRLFPGRPAVGS